MSGAIGPGSLVEVVDASPPRLIPGWPEQSLLAPLVAGDIHIVELLIVGSDGGMTISTDKAPLVFLPCGKSEAYMVERFRPISGGSRGKFDHMLKLDAPSKEPVAA